MRKGFIGPIGDDLPSIIALMLALGIFFSAITYSLNAYNQKLIDLDELKGSIDIGRVVLGEGLVTDINPPSVAYVAKSYSLYYAVCLESKCVSNTGLTSCPDNAYRFNYLVAVSETGGISLHKMVLCTWK